MHGDYPGFTPKEQPPEEEIDNVVEFRHQEKPAEHVIQHILKESGSHESPVLLTEAELSQSAEELVKLQDLEKQILFEANKNIRVLGIGNKRAREINKSMSVKNLPEISKKIHKLERDIALTRASADLPKPMSKKDFDALKPHQKSLQILREAGYDSIAEARAAHEDIGSPKETTVARMIRTAEVTSAQGGIVEGSNVVYVPESVWPGTEPEEIPEQTPGQKPQKSEDQFRRAA